jgi:RNA polymerase sigma-70 factor (ECF subfamily)
LNCTSRYANRGTTARLGAANRRSPFSRARTNNARLASHASANSKPLVQTEPEDREWQAVQEMFLASRRRFLGLAYTVLRNKEDAEDAVQDAFLSAGRHLRSFEGRSALTTWFTRIVLNAALMIRRKRRPSRMESLPEGSAADEILWTERIPSPQPDPEMALAEKETFQWIDTVLGKMSPVLRQAFTLVYYHEMSNEEAAALLGVTTFTFKSRVFRARHHLMNRAKRVFVTPIRRATHFQFSPGRNDFLPLAARPGEITSSEISFS